MCGIAGIISYTYAEINEALLKKMADVLIHRGPDAEGYWLSKENTVGFAHRRLAINDLTTLANQPMVFLDRYSIVYNGELYNYIELRKDLQKQGYQFKTHTDTEVLLALYDRYKENSLQYIDGAFAFSIWDEEEQLLFAARDRFGEKPYYYFNDKDRFLFASEMKALWAAGVDKTIEERMLLNFLALGYLQNQSDKAQTFYKEINSLPPAHYLKLCKGELVITKYWNLDKQICQEISELEAIDKLDQLLLQSVSRRIRTDVNLGLTLSGGLDSSSILYYMQKAEKKTYKSFSAVFPGFEKDEQLLIEKVNQHFQTESYFVHPNENSLVSEFEKLSYYQEEPFASSSVYSQFSVYKNAHQQGVKVLLDGQGADEILSGYHKYIHWYLQELLGRNKFLEFISEKNSFRQNEIDVNWDWKNIIATYFPSHVSVALEQKEYNKIAMNRDISKDFLSCLKGSEWEGIHKPVVTKLNDILHFNVVENGLEELLRYADRNAMANSCEVRLPYLSHEMVTFIFSLPSRYKIKNGFTKYLLRQTVQNKIPKEVVWRTEKIGFEPPQKKWMNSVVMQDYLHESKRLLVNHGILKSQTLQNKKNVAGTHDPDNYDWRYLSAAQLFKNNN